MLIPTAPSDNIQDFLEFLASCYPGDVDALSREGADEESIAQLSRAAGRTLPPYYIAFLREFGSNTGRTHVGGDGFATVEMLLEHYADPAEMKHTPPDGVVISTSGLMPNRILTWRMPHEEPEVGCFSHETIDYLLAQSFRNLLFQETWIYARFVNSKSNTTVSRRDPYMIASVGQLLATIGLAPYWFSDRHGVYAESDTCYVCARADNKETLVWVGSQEPHVRERISTNLREKLGFT